MKKLITYASRAAMTLLLFMAGFNQALAGATWIGGSAIYVNGTWYKGTPQNENAWCEGGNFDGKDLGTITSLIIAGQIQIYDPQSTNWTGNGDWMHYTIDKDDNAWVHLNLSKSGVSGNNMVFQTGGSAFKTTTIDISGLSAGEHTLSVYFGPIDGLYNSNDNNNYVAKFTIPSAPSVAVTPVSYATYVSSYPLNFTDTGIKAYTAKVNTSNGKVVLTQIDKVPANTPVILYKEGGETENIPICYTATDTPEESDLKAGTGAAVATTDGTNYNYILNNVSGIGFYKANGQTVDEGRAYLQTTYNVEASSARMSMVFADEETGIANFSRETISNNRYFDMQGRNVAQPTKGLYIVNGKKVIIK